jgi:hypothetical protein
MSKRRHNSIASLKVRGSSAINMPAFKGSMVSLVSAKDSPVGPQQWLRQAYMSSSSGFSREWTVVLESSRTLLGSWLLDFTPQ